MTNNQEQDQDVKGSTVVMELPSYTADVHHVLRHNCLQFHQAHQPAYLNNPSANPASSNLPTQNKLHPLFPTLQRPIDFDFEWNGRSVTRIFDNSNELKIKPSVVLPLPQTTVGAPILSYWKYSYTDKDKATLTRFGNSSVGKPLEKGLSLRDVARFDYMNIETSIEKSGPVITFEPHEDYILRKGAANVQQDYQQMSLTVDMFNCTKYSVNLPTNLAEPPVMWVFKHVDGYGDGRLHKDHSTELQMAVDESSRSDTDPSTYVASWMQSTPKKSPWTPFPTQYLVDANSGRILACYTRNAPLSKTAGKLTIFPKLVSASPDDFEDLSAEIIESIVIVTAAMVDMQQRKGLVSGLREATGEATRWIESAPHPLRSDP